MPFEISTPMIHLKSRFNVSVLSALSHFAISLHIAAAPLVEPHQVDAELARADSLYGELHANPELSGQEKQTAARLASRGASAMLQDGLFRRFRKPDLAVAIHVHDQLPVGTVAFTYGPYAASADSLGITLYGRGGHGAYPQSTVDPIVMAARGSGADENGQWRMQFRVTQPLKSG